jgi:peptidylprolyl isomerase
MSYLKILFSTLLIVLISSCEDTKKTSTTHVKEVPETKVVAKVDTIQKEIFPKLTKENAIAFLTTYGSENLETKVKIKTLYGDIIIELYEDTPMHRANFIYLVKREVFNNSFFHRVVPNFIIQGGNSDTRITTKKRYEIGNDYLLPAEINRNHTYGSVSGAKEYRENPDKQSFPFEFFIFLGPQTSTGHLNGNYTIFGNVIQGMDVVEKIANLPTDPDGDWPSQNVFITAEVLE